MVSLLRALNKGLVLVLKVQSFVSSTHIIRQLTSTWNSSSQGSDALLCPTLWHCTIAVHINNCRSTHIHSLIKLSI